MSLIVLTALAQGDLSVKTYPVHPAQAADIVEALNSMLSTNAKVVFLKASGQIIVTAPQADQTMTAALLKEVSTGPTRNVRIDVTILQEGASSETSAALNGSGKVVVTPKGVGYNIKLNPKLKSQSETTSDNARQTLLIQSGKEGRIFVGEDVPFAEWLIAQAQQWGYVNVPLTQEFKMRPIGSSLVVLPQVGAGGLITVTLTPELSCLVENKKWERVRYTRVATQVTIRDGATIDIGGAVKDQDFYSRFLAGMGKGGTRTSVQVKLTAHIQDPQGRNLNGSR
jgi:type II secretory pathway component GspD/PulD (secretin)